jgi:hypothetical protein
MPQSMVGGLCEELALLSPDDPEYAARSVDAVLADGQLIEKGPTRGDW